MFRDKVVKELFEYTKRQLDVLYGNDENTTHLNSQNLFNEEKRIFSGPYHFNDDYGYEILSKKLEKFWFKKVNSKLNLNKIYKYFKIFSLLCFSLNFHN